MKRLLPLAIVLAAAFVVSLILSISFLAGLDQVWTAQAAENGAAVAVVLPAERDPFWDELLVSLRTEGVGRRIVYEVTRFNPSDASAREIIEKSALSQVDALLCYPPDAPDLSFIVNAAEDRGLPVLLLENDLPNSRRRVYLGSSPFQIGHLAGEVLRGLPPMVRRAGVLLSQTNADRQTIRNSLFLNGLNEGLSVRRIGFSLQEVISPPGRFAGEELVWGLLREEPALQVLVTTNPKDTLSALQTIVEANRVGKTLLVGMGEDAALREAAATGMIAGLITRDPREWAHAISLTLERVLHGEAVSSYVNLPIHALREAGRGP